MQRNLQAMFRIRDVYPGSRISDPDPKTETNEKGETNLLSNLFL